MFASVLSVALVGGDARPVRVEAHVGSAKDRFKLSGLPDTALRESKDRVMAAILESGIKLSNRIITVNLAPADLPKRGSDYDLPIAVVILVAAGKLSLGRDVVLVGELALDGKVRTASSSIGAGVISSRLGVPCLVGSDQAGSVARVAGSQVHGVDTLAEAVDLIRRDLGDEPIRPVTRIGRIAESDDMAEVKGQVVARRALEIAAAGGHHIVFHGPPGGGKTMLARRIPGLLPVLGDSEAVEVALIRASVGLPDYIDEIPPFRSPHHSATRAALVGGGTGNPTPGEISLAHRGVLFLDELAEFPRSHLDALRQPLEEGQLVISRQGASVTFPSRFQLVAATNPCPCGFHGDHRKPCACTESVRTRYRQRISGPLLDRFDMAVRVDRVEAGDFDDAPAESSSDIAQRVARARSAQTTRGILNRDLGPKDVMAYSIGPGRSRMLRLALESGKITARGAMRLSRVARTIADLADTEVGDPHLGEAMSLRSSW